MTRNIPDMTEQNMGRSAESVVDVLDGTGQSITNNAIDEWCKFHLAFVCTKEDIFDS